MPDQTANILDGLELEKSNYGDSEEELSVKAAILEIFTEVPPKRSQIALARMCISLARNISAGNAKGRAVANEVSTLVATMQLLEGDDEGTPADNLPPDARKLLDALATAPRIDPAPTGDAT